jgi:hypothetical protein
LFVDGRDIPLAHTAMTRQFLTAVLGSVVVEIYCARDCFHSGKHGLPKRYRQPQFYLVIILSALSAGYLATIVPCSTPLMAFGIGAAAPTLVSKLVKKAALVLGD